MTNLDTDKLRALAEKATKGEWSHEPTAFNKLDRILYADRSGMAHGYNLMTLGDGDWNHVNNVDFIAAANPAVILALLDRLAQAEADKAKAVKAMQERRGVYTASRTRHASKWRAWREAGAPVISTWIDEAEQGQTQDFGDLWRRCLYEAANAEALILYREGDDVLKGAWIELGAALSAGVQCFVVGIDSGSLTKSGLVTVCATLESAQAAAIRELKP